jgi:hypothetical protein
VDVWGRYISGNDNPASELVRGRHTLLRYCALFRKFGWRKPVVEELQAIIKLVQKDHPDITNGKIFAAIKDLQARRIFQGDTTLYITPKALHIKLWGEWWETYGPHVKFDTIVETLPTTMRGWFFEMFRYAQESGVATALVAQLLGPAGPFVQTSLLQSTSGAEVFDVLAEGNPARGLECLEATIGKESLDQLRENTAARRHVVWALERMAMWRTLFMRAAKLLARLAVAENEPRIANNASGVFCALFSLGYGDVAPTEAPPEERFPLIGAMLADPDPATRALAIRACGVAFNYGHFSRSGGAEVQGLRIPPQLWRPKTYGEWFSAYEQIWTLLRKALPALLPDEQADAAKHFIQHAYQLGRIAPLSKLVIATLQDLAASGTRKRELADRVEQIVERLSEFPEQDRPLWSALLEQVHGGTGFVGRLHRYVGRTSWRIDATTEQALNDLAREAHQDPSLLDAALPWLLSKDAQNAHLLGYLLGKNDERATLWPRMLAQSAALPNESINLLGGYLRAAKEHDETFWYEQLVACSADDRLVPVLYLLMFQSGLNDKAGMLLATVISEGRCAPLVLRQFVIGTDVRNLSEDTFARWRSLLRAGTAQELEALVELMDTYYSRTEPARLVPLPETVAILTDERLFAEGTRTNGLLTDHSWSELARSAVAQDATQVVPLAAAIFDHLGVDSAVLQQFSDTGPTTWLREVAAQEPRLVWQLIRDRLGPPIDRRAFHLRHWIDNSHAFDARQPNFLDLVPREELWAWVDADVEHRAWYLAHLVAPILAPESLARAVLIRYGHRDDVQSNLRANFDTEGWSGSESTHQEGKRLALETILAAESEPNVRDFITKYIVLLNERIRQAKVAEERDF